MTKILGTVLAGLLVFQAGVPSLGLEEPLVNLVALASAVVIAGLTYFIRGDTPPIH